jgi:Raf kinase inhibitor-like YbhB/YbcL family protein
VRAIAITCLALVCAAAAGCGGGDTVKGSAPKAPMTLEVRSPALTDGGEMPAPFTCEGANVSPPIAWHGLPPSTRSVALLMEDPDAKGGTFVHWSLFNIPRYGVGIAAGQVPVGAREGRNSFGKNGYGGPCPPKGDAAHHYVITVYALRAPIALDVGAAPATVRAAIAKQAVAEGQLTTTFGR